MTEQGKRQMSYWCDELRKLLDEDYPSFLIALTLAQLHHGAIAYIGKPYLNELNRRLIADAKQRAGLCHTDGCNNGIAVALTHYPDCEQCDAQIQAECDRIDKELGDEEAAK